MPTHQPDDASIVSDNNDDEIFRPKKKGLDPRFVLSGLLMFILVSSSGLALVAQNRDTDNRSSASEGEYSNLPISEPCVEAPGNLVKNPSFENGLKLWKKARDISMSLTTTQPPHCKKAVKMTMLKPVVAADALKQSISQRIDIKPSMYYQISFWARTSANDPEYTTHASLSILEDKSADLGPETRLGLGDYAIPTNQWQKYEFLVLSETGFSTLPSRLHLWAEGPKGASIMIDNLVIVERPDVTPSPFPTIEPSGYPTPTTEAPKTFYVPNHSFESGSFEGTWEIGSGLDRLITMVLYDEFSQNSSGQGGYVATLMKVSDSAHETAFIASEWIETNSDVSGKRFRVEMDVRAHYETAIIGLPLLERYADNESYTNLDQPNPYPITVDSNWNHVSRNVVFPQSARGNTSSKIRIILGADRSLSLKPIYYDNISIEEMTTPETQPTSTPSPMLFPSPTLQP